MADRDRAELLRILTELKESERTLREAINAGTSTQTNQWRDIKRQIGEASIELQKLNQERLKGFKAQEDQNNSLSSMYKSLSDLEQRRMILTIASNDISAEGEESLNRMAEINRELAQLSISDVVATQALNEEYKNLTEQISGIQGIDQQILDNLSAQNVLAQNYANMTEGQKEQIQAQMQAYEGIQKTLVGILDTFKILTSGPAGALGTILVGAGFAADKLGGNIRKFGGFVDSAQISALGLGFAFDDAEETAMSLSQQFGGLKDVSFATQLNTNLMATNMGITGDEAATVVGTFAKLNNMSAETATDMAATTKSMAKAAGVPISKVMKDVANNTEAFALYGKNGGKNIAQAAVAAAKLGVEMDAMTKVTDSLLDFETSITNELELGAMLGKNINLDRARGLAAAGEQTEAVKATVEALGGIEAFNKMDIWSRRKAAELLGLQVDEFQSIAANADKLNESSDGIESTWSTITEMFTTFATGPMGNVLKGMGGMVIAAGQMTPFLKDMGINLGGMVKSTFQVLKNMAGMVLQGAKFVAMKIFDSGALTTFGDKLKGIGSSLADSKLGKGIGSLKDKLMAGVGGKPPVPGGAVKPDIPAGGPEKASAFGKINAGALLKGAAAIAIMAGALWIFAKATQEFGDNVPWANVFIGIGAMALLGGVAAILGAAGPLILVGAGAMLIAAGAFYVFGLASQEVAKGLTMLGPALIPFAAGMAAFVSAPYVQFGLGMAGLAIALTAFGAVTPLMLMAAVGMTVLSGALTLFSAALPNFVAGMTAFGNAPYIQFGLGLAGLGVALTTFGLASPFMLMAAVGMTALSGALTLFGAALPNFVMGMVAFANAPYVQFGLGISGLSIALTTFGLVTPFMLMAAVGMTALSGALTLFSSALPNFVAGMTAFVSAPYIQFGLGLAGLGVALTAFGLASPFMLMAAAGMVVLSGALTLFSASLPNFANALGQLGGVDLTPLMSLAGVLTAFGLASPFMLMAAVGMTVLSGALTLFSAALPNFANAVGQLSGVNLSPLMSLSGVLTVFGLVTPFMLMAAVGMTALSGALTLFSAALPNFVNAIGQLAGVDLSPLMSLAAMAPLFILMALAAPGIVVLGAAFTLLSSAMVALSTSLPSVMDQLSQLVQLDFLPIFGLAGALTALSIALAAVAVTGMLALPALLALGLVAGGAAALMGGGDDKENQKMDELIGEIKGLRADMVSGKIGVNMDGVKVTSRISGIVDKIGSNSYAKV